MNKVELLAPAGSMESLYAAIITEPMPYTLEETNSLQGHMHQILIKRIWRRQ